MKRNCCRDPRAAFQFRAKLEFYENNRARRKVKAEFSRLSRRNKATNSASASSGGKILIKFHPRVSPFPAPFRPGRLEQLRRCRKPQHKSNRGMFSAKEKKLFPSLHQLKAKLCLGKSMTKPSLRVTIYFSFLLLSQISTLRENKREKNLSTHGSALKPFCAWSGGLFKSGTQEKLPVFVFRERKSR
jgi:hypothetical protein